MSFRNRPKKKEEELFFFFHSKKKNVVSCVGCLRDPRVPCGDQFSPCRHQPGDPKNSEHDGGDDRSRHSSNRGGGYGQLDDTHYQYCSWLFHARTRQCSTRTSTCTYRGDSSPIAYGVLDPRVVVVSKRSTAPGTIRGTRGPGSCRTRPGGVWNILSGADGTRRSRGTWYR